VRSSENHDAVEPAAETVKNSIIVEVGLDDTRGIPDGDDINLCIRTNKPVSENHLLKHALHMLHRISILGNLVHLGDVLPPAMNRACQRDMMAVNLCEPVFSLGPPPQLAGVRDDKAGRGLVGSGSTLRSESLGETDHGPAVDAPAAVHDSAGEAAQGLVRLAEEDDDAACGSGVGGGEDRDVRLVDGSVEGQADGGEAGVGETGFDDFLHGLWRDELVDGEGQLIGERLVGKARTVEGEAVAGVPAVIFGDVEFEVVVGIVDHSNLIVIVDEEACCRG
jgi:hypothetical protein